MNKTRKNQKSRKQRKNKLRRTKIRGGDGGMLNMLSKMNPFGSKNTSVPANIRNGNQSGSVNAGRNQSGSANI